MLAATSAFAQYDNGSFVGTVHDSTGAVVTGATITVINTETGITVTRTSGSAGEWEVPSLKTGVYRVTISHAGFSDTSASNITLSVGARQRVDLSLPAAGTQETVEVTGVSLQVETESSERGQTITGYQSEALPLVSRNYSDLLGLVTGSRQAPSAATTSSINSLVRAGSYNINGEPSMFNNFLLDGLDRLSITHKLRTK
ncbi:carboxypeptidase-like regulatory domain-containing protein [Granulicella tundricola]|uniref:TonB-dependent receptor, plug n=1 Tax=Granulicella tundricola (strain ATCC BAA-1859 / DSM 23138 / MP5ACTX9) TaxID=1198114 RepID=E8X3Q7_GRATM|nr:carboxypeptidase-like regulatory domain-containing protein [Granulicella tundricola]ADW69335.1 TonB-dependent receptor, plug [Granulicella tundricola MP5ACTX9]